MEKQLSMSFLLIKMYIDFYFHMRLITNSIWISKRKLIPIFIFIFNNELILHFIMYIDFSFHSLKRYLISIFICAYNNELIWHFWLVYVVSCKYYFRYLIRICICVFATAHSYHVFFECESIFQMAQKRLINAGYWYLMYGMLELLLLLIHSFCWKLFYTNSSRTKSDTEFVSLKMSQIRQKMI